MNVKLWLGVIVSLIVIVSCIFFFWGGDLEEDALIVNQSLQNKSIIEEVEEVENFTDVVEEKVGSIQSVNLFLNSEVEHIELVRSTKSLNLDETLASASGYLDKKRLPLFLGGDSNFERYEQKISFSDDFVLTKIEDNDYMDGNVSYGFAFSSSDLIFNYTIDFGGNLLWNNLTGEEIHVFGKPYEVVSSSYDLGIIELLEFPYSFTLKEGDVVNIKSSFYNDTNFSIYFINEEKLILNVNGEMTQVFRVGDFYYADDFLLFIDSFLYSPKSGGRVEIIISPMKILLEEGFFDIDSEYNDIRISIDNDGEHLDKITFSLYAGCEEFFTSEPGYDITLPFFETLVFTTDSYHRDDDKKKAWDVYLDAVTYTVLDNSSALD